MSVSAATLVAASIAAAALALRLGAAGFPGLGPQSLPLLFVAAPVRRGYPPTPISPGAWLAAVTAGGLAAIEVFGSVRGRDSGKRRGLAPTRGDRRARSSQPS